jgi:hypothetical protein
MSQNVRLEILRRLVVLKVFSKKRNFFVRKTQPLMLTKTVCFDFAAQLAQWHSWPGLPELLSAPSWLDS